MGARPNEEKGLSELASSGSEEESKPDLKEILLALKKEANGGEVPPELENQLQSLRVNFAPQFSACLCGNFNYGSLYAKCYMICPAN